MAKLTYDDKIQMNENANIPAVNKGRAVDWNEIKTSVNTLYDNQGDLSSLTTTDKSSLVGAINEVNGKTEVYSTTETLTNKVWVDNKPIYRKVIIDTTSRSANLNYSIAHGISNLENITHFETFFWQTSSICMIGSSTSPLGGSERTTTYFNGSNITIRNTWESTRAVIIVEYTKTTD